MDSVIQLLRESRKFRDAKFLRQENQQILECNSRRKELEELAEQTDKYIETIGRNLHSITGRRHAISKIVHESNRCDGLPISNKYHRPTLDFLDNVVEVLNSAEGLFAKPDEENNGDTCDLSTRVQACAESASAVLKGTKSSVDKVEMLMENMHIILDPYNEEEPDLERSIFDE